MNLMNYLRNKNYCAINDDSDYSLKVKEIIEYLRVHLGILDEALSNLDDLLGDYQKENRIYSMDDFDEVCGCLSPTELAYAVQEGVSLDDNGKVWGGFDLGERYFMIRPDTEENSTFYWKRKEIVGTLTSITNKFEDIWFPQMADEDLVYNLTKYRLDLPVVKAYPELKTLLEELAEL